ERQAGGPDRHRPRLFDLPGGGYFANASALHHRRRTGRVRGQEVAPKTMDGYPAVPASPMTQRMDGHLVAAHGFSKLAALSRSHGDCHVVAGCWLYCI